jgi:hypothetical protein
MERRSPPSNIWMTAAFSRPSGSLNRFDGVLDASG